MASRSGAMLHNPCKPSSVLIWNCSLNTSSCSNKQCTASLHYFRLTRLVTWGQPAFLFVILKCRVIITRPKCVVNVPCHWMRKTYLPKHFGPMMFRLDSALLLIRWKACAITPQPVTVIHDFGLKQHTRIRMGKWRHAINLSLRCHWFLTFITWSVSQADHQSLMFLQRDDCPRSVGWFFTELI